MYKLISYAEGKVLVTNDQPEYRAEHLVESEQAAEALVVGLNQEARLAELAIYRFEFETAGLEVGNGLRVLTDRESRAQLDSAYTTIKDGLIPDTDWKAANGWQLVTLAELEPIVKAVAAHVRGCFRGERVVENSITRAQTLAEINAIDIGEAFQAAYEQACAEVPI